MAGELNPAWNALQDAIEEYIDASLATSIQSSDTSQQAQVVPGSLNLINSKLFAKEYLRISSLESQIQQARAAIKASRNSSLAAVPINALPVEVLIRIFQLMAPSQRCKLDPWYRNFENLPDYRIPLTHVCTHWRQIIIRTPRFWTHIDLTPSLQTHEPLRSRVQTFITRASHSPLDIHITAPYPVDEHWETTGLQEFLGPLVPRIRSLDLLIMVEEDEEYDPTPSVQNFCSTILSVCFGTRCTPGTLTQVMIEVDTGHCFLQAAEAGHHHDNHLLLDVPAQHLEDVWQHVTVLRLEGLAPFWTSKAYHGLVELNFAFHSDWRAVTISELHLANILSSSPQLRVLNFGVLITLASTPCKAVSLLDLETLVLRPKSEHELDTLMRLITPGSKPLSVTVHAIRFGFTTTYKATSGISRFLAQANIATLHFLHQPNYIKLLDSLDKVRNLGYTIASQEDIYILASNKPTHLYAERLHILRDRPIEVGMDTLLELVRIYAPRELLLWEPYRIVRSGLQIEDQVQIEEELSIPGTVAKVMHSQPYQDPDYYICL